MATVRISDIPQLNMVLRLKSWATDRWHDRAAATTPLRPRAVELKTVRPGRVLTIAPHMDDEAIGAGGLLALHQKAGSTLGLVFASSHEDEISKKRSGDNATDDRTAQAKAVAARLGVKFFRALPHAGGRLGLKELAMAKQFAEILTSWEPDQIIAPFPADHQRDHQAVATALAAAIEFTRWRGEVWCCEVWSTLWPNVGVDISSVIEQKREMIALYNKQNAGISQANAALGLNQFRGQRLNVDYAETFRVCNAAEYIRLAGSLN